MKLAEPVQEEETLYENIESHLKPIVQDISNISEVESFAQTVNSSSQILAKPKQETVDQKLESTIDTNYPTVVQDKTQISETSEQLLSQNQVLTKSKVFVKPNEDFVDDRTELAVETNEQISEDFPQVSEVVSERIEKDQIVTLKQVLIKPFETTVEEVSESASDANIEVTAVLGSGETLYSANSIQGKILSLQILQSGSGYTTAPTLNLTQIGDGTAQAEATIITGEFTYPGRYLNDDGHISSYNFIQDRDYYQKFSYVVKVKQSLDKYRSVLKNLIHPAGMKLFGEYVTVDEGTNLYLPIRDASDNLVSITTKTYWFETGNVYINYTDHGLAVSNTVYLDWITGNLAASNVTTAYPYDSVKGPYKVKTVVNTNQFIVNTVQYIANTGGLTYLANTLLPNTSGTVNVGKVIY